jgi:hypothetical protein
MVNKLSELDRFMLFSLVLSLAITTVVAIYAYRVGYADGARASAPLAAPPTKTERAR